MNLAASITPLLLTFNEAPNIARTLEKLHWAGDVVVVDSGSTDETLTIVARYPQARVIHRRFDDFASQCNFGLMQVKSEWVLSLDADYVLTDSLIVEMAELDDSTEFNGYSVNFIYCIFGRALRGTVYPPRTVLYRKKSAAYRNEGHGHRVTIDGRVSTLKSTVLHDDRKPLSRWFSSQQSYAKREAEFLLSSSPEKHRRTDRIRLMGWPAPPLVFLYTLFAKGCILDGWYGWCYVLQRTLAETMIALELADRRLRSEPLACAVPGE